jgi:small subunit ribosomal protein S2
MDKTIIERMFSVGAHFGHARSRRHPSVAKHLFGAKGAVELFDLEKTAESLEAAKSYIAKLASEGKVILLVSGKAEARDLLRATAERVGLPYVASRWIGGTLTNFPEIKRRIDRLEKLMGERERGELGKFTKLERLRIDREIEDLERAFGGLKNMGRIPDALLVVDSRREHIAVAEAKKVKIPVIALINSDCDASLIHYPIPANDASVKSIEFFLGELADAYRAAYTPKREDTPQASQS